MLKSRNSYYLTITQTDINYRNCYKSAPSMRMFSKQHLEEMETNKEMKTNIMPMQNLQNIFLWCWTSMTSVFKGVFYTL